MAGLCFRLACSPVGGALTLTRPLLSIQTFSRSLSVPILPHNHRYHSRDPTPKSHWLNQLRQWKNYVPSSESQAHGRLYHSLIKRQENTSVWPVSLQALHTESKNNKASIKSASKNTELLEGKRKDLGESVRTFSLSPQGIVEAAPSAWQPYLKLIRLDRPIGTWLLFWPCTWSIAMAADPGHLPDPVMLAWFGLGSFIMRGCGCIINDMWDKDFDKKVERTRDRPLPAGEITHFQALVYLGVKLSLALGILLQFNWYSIILGASAMSFVIVYPLMKRFTYWPQVFLGVTLNWGVLISWSALHGVMTPPGALLYASCVLWTMIYDSIYSHQDKADDILIGVKSTALRFGDNTKYWLSGFGTAMIGGLGVTGYMCDQTWPFYVGLGLTATHVFHQILSVDINKAEDCGKKFRSNKQLGLIMFLGIMAGTYLKKEKDSDDTQAITHADTLVENTETGLSD